MDKSTKFLVIVSILIIGGGLGLLWFGIKPSTTQVSPQSTPSVGNQPHTEATSSSSTVDVVGEKVLVTKVVDGDTIEIEGGKKVRLIGVDTPETVDPKRPVGCFGKEASNETKSLLEGKAVILEKDISETDKYKRLLRFVFLPVEGGNLLFVDDYLIREGFGKVLTIPPDVKYSEQFLDAQREARENKRGLWGRC